MKKGLISTVFFLAYIITISFDVLGKESDKSEKANQIQKNSESWTYIKNTRFIELSSSKKIQLENLESENLIVIFWANWCDSCKLHMVELGRFIKKNRFDKLASKLEVVAVNIDKNQEDALLGLDFFKKNNLNFRLVHLKDQGLVGRMSISKIPLDLLFDKRRELVAFHVGLSELKYNNFTSAIKGLM